MTGSRLLNSDMYDKHYMRLNLIDISFQTAVVAVDLLLRRGVRYACMMDEQGG